MYRRAGTCWTEDLVLRARYERPAREAYPDLRHRRVQRRVGPVDVYTVAVPVPGYDPRTVTVEVERGQPNTVAVYADGPTDSPHRFGDRDRHRLCIWHPRDPDDRRWVPEDGLLALLGMTATHLFKEAWWREHGEWLGHEAPHTAAPVPETGKQP